MENETNIQDLWHQVQTHKDFLGGFIVTDKTLEHFKDLVVGEEELTEEQWETFMEHFTINYTITDVFGDWWNLIDDIREGIY